LQTVTAILVLGGLSSPWVLALLSFAMSSLASYTIPAARAMVRDLVDREDLQRGTAVMSLCIDTARLLGPGLAGILLAVIPNGAVLLIDASTFFISAALILRIKLDPLPARKASALEQLLGGLRYSMGHRWLWVTATCGMFITGSWMAGYQLLGPQLAHSDYGGPAFWGLCGTAYTAGLLLGGVLALKIQPKQPVIASVFASTGLALPLIALGLHLPAPLVVILLATAAALLALAMTWWSAGIPALVDREHLARSFAFNSAVELGGVPLAYAAVGTTHAVTNIQAPAFELMAAAVIVIASTINLIALYTFARPNKLPQP
ncbi:MAG: MFS transporter, partial [Arthrobacter sp.]|nr:MFS transporter [Arthrobacter sp.]